MERERERESQENSYGQRYYDDEGDDIYIYISRKRNGINRQPVLIYPSLSILSVGYHPPFSTQ